MRVDVSYRTVHYMDLALGAIPIVNTVKNLAILFFQTFVEESLEPMTEANDFRLYVTLKDPSMTMLEAVPLVGNLLSVVLLVLRVVEDCFCNIDSLREDFFWYRRRNPRGDISEVDYLFVSAQPQMSVKDKEYCVRLALENRDIDFLTHIQEKVGIDKFCLCKGACKVLRWCVEKEKKDFPSFLEKVRPSFEEVLKRSLSDREALELGALGDLEILSSLLEKEEVSYLQVKHRCACLDKETIIPQKIYRDLLQHKERLDEKDLTRCLGFALVKRDFQFLLYLEQEMGDKISVDRLQEVICSSVVIDPSWDEDFRLVKEVGRIFEKQINRDRKKLYSLNPLLYFLWVRGVLPNVKTCISKEEYNHS